MEVSDNKTADSGIQNGSGGSCAASTTMVGTKLARICIPGPRIAGETAAQYIHRCIYHFFSHTMQWFSDDDDGVPPFCRCWPALCPLHHEHFLNRPDFRFNWVGDIGFPYFDKHRKFFQGISSLATLFAMVCTIYGCMALSTDINVVERTYWGAGSFQNTTSGQSYSVYIGLQSMVYIQCPFVGPFSSYDHSCYKERIDWTDQGCGDPQSIISSSSWFPHTIFNSNSLVLNDACSSCANQAISLWTTTICTCVFLTLAFLGAQTRMRAKADVTVQKILGMMADSFGAITLAYPLAQFENKCLSGVSTVVGGIQGITSEFWFGPGFVAYVVCCSVAFLRAAIHWLTPMPGRGLGFKWICMGRPAATSKSDTMKIIARDYSADL